jgi:hypothetical protein
MIQYNPKWRESLPRPPLKKRDKETWFECLKRHSDLYQVDHYKVLELYQQLRTTGIGQERAAKEAAWTWGLTDDFMD